MIAHNDDQEAVIDFNVAFYRFLELTTVILLSKALGKALSVLSSPTAIMACIRLCFTCLTSKAQIPIVDQLYTDTITKIVFFNSATIVYTKKDFAPHFNGKCHFK